jgi:hypothetical protein
MSGNIFILALALTVAADPSAPVPPSNQDGARSNERICRGGGA